MSLWIGGTARRWWTIRSFSRRPRPASRMGGAGGLYSLRAIDVAGGSRAKSWVVRGGYACVRGGGAGQTLGGGGSADRDGDRHPRAGAAGAAHGVATGAVVGAGDPDRHQDDA